MGVKIQIRRGNQADLPTLDTGEFGFTIDTERLYIGNPSGSGNTLINFGGAGFDMGNGADGYVTFYTGPNAIGGDNDFFWDRENNRLGIHTTTPTHELTIDGYITPATDNVHQLGTPTQRWEALWLGPGSLHIHSNPSETFTSFDWRIGIDQTTGNEGKLIFSQGDQTYFAVDPVTGNVSFDAGDELRLSGALVLPELLSAPLYETGYGKVYVDSDDKALHFLDSNDVDYNLLITGGTGTGTGNVDSSEGADGYVTFFIAPGVIAGDNDFFFNRVNHNLTLMSGGKIGVGITSPTSPFHAQLESAGTFYQAWVNSSAQFDLATVSSPSNMAVFQSWNGLHILLKPQSGFVGINSTASTPANALDVSGAVSIGSGFYGTTAPTSGLRVEGLVAFGTAVSPGTTALLIDQDADDTNTIEGMSGGSTTFDITPRSSPSRLDFSTSNLRTLVLSPAGNGVGISTGTTNVANKLDVAGSVAIGSGYVGTFAGTNNLIVQGSVGIGTLSPYEALTINGIIALQEQDSTPDNIIDGYGRIYVKSDNKLYFQDGLGLETDLVTGGGTLTSTQGADGYLAFFTGSTTLAGDNDLYWDRATERLGIGIGTFQANDKVRIYGGNLRVSFNGTQGSNLILTKDYENAADTVENDVLGVIIFSGENVSPVSSGSGASISALASGSGGSGRIPASITFGTSSGIGAVVERMRINQDGNVGIGTDMPIEKLTIQGVLALKETSTPPANNDGYGKFYVKTDNLPYYKDDLGSERIMATSFDGSDGYVSFYTSSGVISGDNDFFWERVNNRLQIGGTPATLRKLSVLLDTETGDGIGITNTTNSSGAFAQLFLQSDIGFLLLDQFSSGYTGTVAATGGTIPLSNMGLVSTSSSAQGLVIYSSNGQSMHLGAGNSVFLHLTPEKNVGIGTVSPIEALTVNGVLALQELTANAATLDGYGKLFVRDDNKLYYKDGLGVTFDLTSTGGVTATQGSDGYVAFFTGTSTIAGDNDLFYDRVSSRFSVGTASVINPNATLVVGGTILSVFEDETRGSGYQITSPLGAARYGLKYGSAGNVHDSIVMMLANREANGPLAFATDNGASGAAGEVERMRIAGGTETRVGIGTSSPIEALTINGTLALQEQDVNPATQDGYGKIYVKDDDKLYFKNGLGTVYDLTAAAGVSAAQGSDGYIAFFTGANTIAGDNDLFWDRVNNRLGIGTTTPAFNFQVQGGDHTSMNINAPLAFQSALTFSDTTNGQDWSFYRVQGTTDLALHSSAIPGNLLYFTSTGGDGYVLPGADITHALGNPTTRWESLYLGPSSLHFRTTAAETIETLDWTIGVGTNENKGDLLFYQSGHKNVRMKEEGGIFITATKQYHGLTLTNGTNITAQLIGFTADNDGGGLDLYTGTVNKIRLNSDSAVPNYINHQGAFGIGTNNPTSTARMHVVVASGGGDAIRLSRDVSFDWDIGIASDSDLFIETGGGSRFVHIDSGGNIGLGTSTPQNRLDIEGAAVIGASFSGTNTAPTNGLLVEGKMAVGGPTSVSGTTAAIFRSSGNGHIVQLDRSAGYSYFLDIDASGDFDLMDNDGTTSRLHIDTSTGNVGIGTITPSYKLTVAVSGSVYPEIITNTDSTIEVGWFLDASRGAFGSKTNHEFGLMAGDTVGLTLKKIGTPVLVGIGTRFPIEILTVNGAIALQELDVNPATQDGYGKLFVRDDDKLYFKNGLGTVYDLTAAAGVSASQGSDGYVAFFTGGTTLAGDNDFFWDRVNNRLGVGTISPQVKVQFADEDSAGGVELYLQGLNATDTYADIAFINSTGDYMGDIGLDMIQSGEYYLNNLVNNIGHFKFWTRNSGNDTVKMFIGNTGRVGVGTEAPDAMLHVAGDGYFDGYLMPRTDNMWGLGTPALRWRDLYLGPESLHIISKTADSGRPNRDFRWTIDEAGILTLSEDSTTVATFSSAGVSFPVGGGSAAAPQYTISSVQTTGFTASFDTVYRCNPTGGGFTVTLPAASGGTGKTIIVKNVTSSTNTITIQGTGGELIDTQSSVGIVEGYASVTFVSYGSEWGRV